MSIEFAFIKSFVGDNILKQEWELYQQQQTEISFREYLISKNKIAPIAKKIIDEALAIKNIQFINDSELLQLYQNYIKYIQKRLVTKQSYSNFSDWLYEQGILKIKRYRIVDKLGKGGFGKVYKAYDTKLDKYVAIKMLLELDNLERFEREMKICANLEHPNIVPVFDCGEHNETPYVVMKFVSGETLSAKIVQGITQEQVETILIKVAKAIKLAHNENIIHRDLKPSNIIIDKNDEPIVLDFGIAKMINKEDLTKTNEIIGSIHYMAPEILKGEIISKTSDIYSLGVILYEMLVGKSPYKGTTTSSLMYEIMEGNHSFPQDSTIPKKLRDICQKAMQKDPTQRFQTIEEFLSSFSAENKQKTRKTKVSPKPQQKQNKILFTVVTIAVTIIILLVITMLFGTHSIQTSPLTFYYKDKMITDEESLISIYNNIHLEIPQNTFFYIFSSGNILEKYSIDKNNAERKITISLQQFNDDTHWHFICLNRKLNPDEIKIISKKTFQRAFGLDEYYNDNPQNRNSYLFYFSEILPDLDIKQKKKFTISSNSFIVKPFIKTKKTSKFLPLLNKDIIQQGDLLRIKVEVVFPEHHLLILAKDNTGIVSIVFPKSRELVFTESYQTYHRDDTLYIPDKNKLEGFPFDDNTGKEHLLSMFSVNPIDVQKAKLWMEQNDLEEYVKKLSERGFGLNEYYKEIEKPKFPMDIVEIDHQ